VLDVIPLRRYADAFHAYERADAAELKARRSDPMLARVEEIAHELAQDELEGLG
jgi:hypothetical protein